MVRAAVPTFVSMSKLWSAFSWIRTERCTMGMSLPSMMNTTTWNQYELSE